MKRRGLCFECLVPQVHYVAHAVEWIRVSSTCGFWFCFAKVGRMDDVGMLCAYKFAKWGDFLLCVNCTAAGERGARCVTELDERDSLLGNGGAGRNQASEMPSGEKAVLSTRESRSLW